MYTCVFYVEYAYLLLVLSIVFPAKAESVKNQSPNKAH